MDRRKALAVFATIGGTWGAGCLDAVGDDPADPTDPEKGEIGIEIVGPTSVTTDAAGTDSQSSTEHHVSINIYLDGMPDAETLSISADWLLEQPNRELEVVDTWSETLGGEQGFSTDVDFVQPTFSTDVSLVQTSDTLQMRFDIETVADGETFENSREGSLSLP